MEAGQGPPSWATTEWPGVFEALVPRLRQAHGFWDNVLRNTRNNQAEGIPILIVDAAVRDYEVVFSSRGLEATAGWKPEATVGKRGVDFLRLKPDAMHDTLNRKVWTELEALRNRVSVHAAGSAYPKPYTGLVVSATASGYPFWNLMDVVPLENPQSKRCRYVAFVVLRLEAPVPRAIFQEGSIDAALATALVEMARADLAASNRRPDGVWGAEQPAEEGQQPQQQGEFAGTLLQACESVRKVLVHIHEDAQEGEHYVPKLGWAAVEMFDRLNTLGRVAAKVQEEILSAWHFPEDSGAHELACLVADPAGVDCPIVFASEGFEDLTGYKRLWALGRNCRFMQPNKQRTNMAVNRSEFRRLRDFCISKKATCMLSLLLNERADGRLFWNILYLQHIHPSGDSDAGRGPGDGRYIFGVLTSATVQKDALDMLVLQELGGPGSGEKALQVLRDKLRKREEHFRPSKKALLDLMADVSLAWVRESGRGIASFWERSLFVPRVGVGAALDFSGVWPMLVDAYAPQLQDQLGVSDEAMNGLRANKDTSAICVVSDPLGMDCPLVFLSRAFQETTGYDAAFALGRNSRFLQPSTPGMNEAVNGEELATIRAFCALRGQLAVGKPPLVAMLLNQKRTGERLWNLLHLNHITVAGHPYILGTYRVLAGVPMPGLIKDALTSEAVLHHDEAQMLDFISNLGTFCSGLQRELKAIVAESARERAVSSASDDGIAPLGCKVAEMEAHASQALKAYLKSCSQTMVPESPLPASMVETFDVTAWSKLLEELRHTSQLYSQFLRETAGPSTSAANPLGSPARSAACLANPALEDCPLTYVSAEFEAVTGYTRQAAIGKNCRFLQPQDANVNNLLNRGELERVREFCKSTASAEGSRITAFLVNVEGDKYPFWNFIALEHVNLEGRPYILAVLTRAEFEVGRLSELLAMDSDGILELDRLRRGVKQRESSLLEMGPTLLLEDAIAGWTSSLPPYFELPVFEAGGPSLRRPSVSLELTANSDLPKIFPDAIEEGIRHFHLSFEGDIQACRDDNRLPGLTGQLFALRLAELMMNGDRRRFDFLRAGIRFTIVTPPAFVGAFAELRKGLQQCRYDIDCWMLDCRGASIQHVREAWQVMSAAVRNGDVASLGLWAVSRQARDAIACMPGSERVSVVSLEMYAGRELDAAKSRLLSDFRSQGVEVEAYRIFGPSQKLLNSVAVQQQAAAVGVDPAMLLMKWAEAQDCIAVVPQLRAGAAPDAAKASGAASASGVAGIKAAQTAQPVNIHRNFVRQYRNARPAQDCAAMLEASLGVAEAASECAAGSPKRAALRTSSAPPREAPREAGPLPASPRRSNLKLEPPPLQRARLPERCQHRRHSERPLTGEERQKQAVSVQAMRSGKGRSPRRSSEDRAGASSSPAQPSSFGMGEEPSGASLRPVPPSSPTPMGKRFVRQHLGSAAGAGEARVADGADESETAAEQAAEGQEGAGGVAVSKAMAKLWERGWTLQAIADLFDLDEATVAQQVSRP